MGLTVGLAAAVVPRHVVVNVASCRGMLRNASVFCGMVSGMPRHVTSVPKEYCDDEDKLCTVLLSDPVLRPLHEPTCRFPVLPRATPRS